LALNIKAVLQAQGLKLFFAEFAAQEALGLFFKLRHALVYQGLVDMVIGIHRLHFIDCLYIYKLLCSFVDQTISYIESS
jgi:hypothetical protein